MRVKLGGVFKYVASSFDSWGDDPILFDIFQMPNPKLPPKNDVFFQDCMRIAVYVFCENHIGNLDSRRIVRMSEIPLTACLVLKETSYDI